MSSIPQLTRDMRSLEQRLARLEALERGAPVTQWTPVIGGTTGNPTVTYSVQSGGYVRVGALTICWGRISLSAVTVAGTGAITITGLPRTSYTGNFLGGVVIAYAANMDYAASIVQLVGYVESNATQAVLVETQDNAAPDTNGASRLAAGDDIVFTIIYPAG